MILPSDLSAWRVEAGRQIASGRDRPGPMNTDLGVWKVMGRHARIDFNLGSNWAERIRPFDNSQHRTDTREQPNSLTSPELRAFLERFLVEYPELFAFAYLGFVTGLRPSSLRPLRRKGATPDLLWEERLLLVRQSNSRGDHVKEGPKAGGDDEIQLPDEVIGVLRWHVEHSSGGGPQQESDLPVTAEHGGFYIEPLTSRQG
jgi:integrase